MWLDSNDKELRKLTKRIFENIDVKQLYRLKNIKDSFLRNNIDKAIEIRKQNDMYFDHDDKKYKSISKELFNN